MASVGTVVIDIKADTAKLVSGMEKAEKTIKRSIGNIQRTVLTLTSAYAGLQGIMAFKNMINDSLDAADAVGKLAQKLGLTSEQLSKYQYAAHFSAISTADLNAGLSAMIRRLNNFQRNGGGAAAKAFKELGISADYARKHFTSTDTAFKEILKRLEKMPDGFKKTAIAQDIFSKNASRILRLSAEDLKKFGDEAERIGLTISQSTYQMAAAYHDQMDRIDARLKGFKRTISFSLVKPLDAVSKTALEFADNAFGQTSKEKILTFGKTGSKAIESIIYGLGFAKDTITGIEFVIDAIKIAFYGLADVIALALEPARRNINAMIDAYNYIAKKLSKSTFDFHLQSSIPDINKKIVDIKSDMASLVYKMHDGRDAANEFAKLYKTNLKVVETESKKTKKSIDSTNTSLNDQVKLSQKIKQIWKPTLYKSIDRKSYFKDLFLGLGYSIKAYDKAVEIYQKLTKKYANDPKALKIIKENYDKAIDNLNSWIKLNYKAAKEIPTIWDNISKSMADSMESNFFDEITGKFKSFKEFMRSLFRDLASSIINPFAHQLAGGLTNSIMGMFEGGLPQTTKKLTKQNAIKLGLKAIGNGVYQDSSGNKIVTDTLGNVTRAFNSKGNVVSDVMTLKSIATLPSTIKTGASFFTNPSAALTGMLYAPSAYLGQAAGALYGAGYTDAGSFLAGGANFFGGGLATGLHGAALAGQLGTAVGVGGLGGYLFGTLGDKLLGADTYAGLGGALGGVAGGVAGSLGAFTSLGSAAGPVGALIGAVAGSLLGGLFGHTKVTGQTKGIEFLNDVSKNNIDGRDYLTTYYKKKSWLHTKKWSSTKYQDFNDTEIDTIQQVITNYDYLLAQLGKSAEIVIKAGKYNSIEDFLSTGATKAFIKEATTADLDKVYQAWKDYAKAVNKKVYEAFNEEINNYIKDIRNWKLWLYGRQGDTLEALKYKANYLESDFENLAKTFGLVGVTVSNFAQKYKEAISKNLTPNEIKKWEALGNALKSATDAADALRNATLKQFDSEAKYKEYMVSLDKQVQLQQQAQLQAQMQLQQNWINFVTNLTDVFHNLKNTAQSFIDSLHDTNSAQSYTFFAKRYNDVKAQIAKDLQSNNYKALQEDFSVYTSVASSLKSSVLFLKNPELYNKVSKTILEDATKYRDLFNESESITGAIAKSNGYLKEIADYTKDTKIHTDTLTQGGGIVAAIQSLKDPSLTTAINNLISYLSTKYTATTVSNGSTIVATTTNSNPTTVSTTINPEDLTLGNFIANETKPEYITAFSKLEGIKTKNELDEDINLLNTYYYTDIDKRADYIKNLTDNTKNKLKTLLQSLNGLTDDIAKSFESSSNTNVVAAISNTAKGVGISNAQFFDIYKTDVEKMQKVAELYNNKKISTLEYANDLNYYAAMFLQDVGNPANLTGNALDTYNKMVDYYKSTRKSVKNLGGIPKYAEGGIVTKPTLGLIGEAGYPEAIIPMKNGRDIPVKIDNSGMEQKLNDLVILTEQQANEIRKMRKEIQDMNERSAA